MALLFLFSDYLKGPFETTFWPAMGFLFLPTTALGWAASWHIGHGHHDTWAVSLIVFGLLYDFGVFRIGRKRRGGSGPHGDPPEGGGGPGGGRMREIVIEAEKVG